MREVLWRALCSFAGNYLRATRFAAAAAVQVWHGAVTCHTTMSRSMQVRVGERAALGEGCRRKQGGRVNRMHACLYLEQ